MSQHFACWWWIVFIFCFTWGFPDTDTVRQLLKTCRKWMTKHIISCTLDQDNQTTIITLKGLVGWNFTACTNAIYWNGFRPTIVFFSCISSTRSRFVTQAARDAGDSQKNPIHSWLLKKFTASGFTKIHSWLLQIITAGFCKLQSFTRCFYFQHCDASQGVLITSYLSTTTQGNSCEMHIRVFHMWHFAKTKNSQPST